MKWKVFIVTHGPIIDSYYENDPDFSYDNYVIINVSNDRISHAKFNVLNKCDIPDYKELGKWYAESEAIYNVFKCGFYQDVEYVGFIHYDFELLSENSFVGHNVTRQIQQLVNAGETFVSFFTYDFVRDYNQKIMMDLNRPNELVGDGRNCYESIIEDYNSYFEKNLSKEILMSKRINLCSAFLCQSSIFEELMMFCSWVIESGRLSPFDLDHNYRFQGGMMERYIGCFSHQYNLAELPLEHRYNKENYGTRKKIEDVENSHVRGVKRIFVDLINRHLGS